MGVGKMWVASHSQHWRDITFFATHVCSSHTPELVEDRSSQVPSKPSGVGFGWLSGGSNGWRVRAVHVTAYYVSGIILLFSTNHKGLGLMDTYEQLALDLRGGRRAVNWLLRAVPVSLLHPLFWLHRKPVSSAPATPPCPLPAHSERSDPSYTGRDQRFDRSLW